MKIFKSFLPRTVVISTFAASQFLTGCTEQLRINNKSPECSGKNIELVRSIVTKPNEALLVKQGITSSEEYSEARRIYLQSFPQVCEKNSYAFSSLAKQVQEAKSSLNKLCTKTPRIELFPNSEETNQQVENGEISVPFTNDFGNKTNLLRDFGTFIKVPAEFAGEGNITILVKVPMGVKKNDYQKEDKLMGGEGEKKLVWERAMSGLNTSMQQYKDTCTYNLKKTGKDK